MLNATNGNKYSTIRQKKIYFISLERCESTQHSSNTKPASQLSTPFALGSVSIRPVQDLGEPYEYVYSRIKEPYEYGYSRVKEPHEYEYFKTKELHGYGYLIVKKLDRDLQERHGFKYLIISRLITCLRNLAFKTGGNIIIRKYITFCDKEYLLYY